MIINVLKPEGMCNEDGMIEIWRNWDEEVEADPITKDELFSRISIGFINIYTVDDIYFDYNLNEIFTDHGYRIYANFSGEIISLGLEG